MNEYQENTYWIAIAHLHKWSAERINHLIIRVWHELNLSWSEFFENDKIGLREIFAFTEKELGDLELIKKDLPRLAFLAEQLHNEGFDLIPITSKSYSSLLKENFRTKNCPPLLYVKGRKTILQEEAVAIVGSRDAGELALQFTNTIAKKCVADFKVIVSGFAKGVDKQALDSTLAAHGKSIIVLPQGILTFQSGFKQYYEPIVNGEALVLSTFFPTAGWDVGLAMARNAYIYGLAKDIYVAESDSKGGTWEGAMDGLKKRRKVFVRWPDSNEKNANRKLVEMGAIAVNMEGEPIVVSIPRQVNLFDTEDSSPILQEPSVDYTSTNGELEKKIIALLTGGMYTSAEIKFALNLDIDTRRLSSLLRKNPNIVEHKVNPSRFSLKNNAT